MKKHVLVKNMFTNGFVITSLKRKFKEWKHTNKEKVLGVAVSKEGHANNLLRHDKIHHYRFPSKIFNFI